MYARHAVLIFITFVQERVSAVSWILVDPSSHEVSIILRPERLLTGAGMNHKIE